MKVLVVGLGKSGKAAQKHLEGAGHEVIALDDANGPIGIQALDGVELFVPSPGVSRRHLLYKEALCRGIEIAGEVELGLRLSQKKCVGVTGTNGKSSLCALVVHVLSSSGIKARAVGNFGTPLIEAVKGSAEVLVVELSSFQLETTRAQALDAAVLLPIEPDHLDRYDSFEEYKSVKESIKRLVKPNGHFFSGEMMESAQFLAGICGVSKESFQSHRTTFPGLAHRLEKLKEIDGVLYINDSKSTNIASTLFALKSMDRPAVLLLGGKDKGLDYSEIKMMKEKIRAIIAFGGAAPRIARELATCFSLDLMRSLTEAVETSRARARPGDVILLSPGSSSFDHFDNYIARGEKFKMLVTQVVTCSPASNK